MSMTAIREARILTGRSLRHIVRSPDTVITTAVTPVAMMLLFVFVLGGALQHDGTGSYIIYLMPGILIITIASGVAYTSYRLFLDLSNGLVPRLQSMPISRSSILWSHVLTSLAANAISIAIVLAVGIACGFRPQATALGWLAIAGMLIVITLTLTWIAVLAGLCAKSVDGASAFSYPLIFLPFISSAFVPTDSMRTAVAWFAQNQPITAIVDSLRALFSAQSASGSIWIALLWLGAVLVVAWIASTAVYRRRIGA